MIGLIRPLLLGGLCNRGWTLWIKKFLKVVSLSTCGESNLLKVVKNVFFALNGLRVDLLMSGVNSRVGLSELLNILLTEKEGFLNLRVSSWIKLTPSLFEYEKTDFSLFFGV